MLEGSNFADYGLAGILIFMTFQYLVKPLIDSLKSRSNGTGPRVVRAERDIQKLDEGKVSVSSCKLIHKTVDENFAEAKRGQKVIIDKLDGALGELATIRGKLT